MDSVTDTKSSSSRLVHPIDSIAPLLVSMYRIGVHLWVEGGQLRYQAPNGALTPERMKILRDRKAEIVNFLAQSQSFPSTEHLLPGLQHAEGAPLASDAWFTSNDREVVDESYELERRGVISPHWDLMDIKEPWELLTVRADYLHSTVEYRVGWNNSVAFKCCECEKSCPKYDSQPERTWGRRNKHSPTILIRAIVPRYICVEHGVRTAPAPWLAQEMHYAETGDSSLGAFIRRADASLTSMLNRRQLQATYHAAIRALRPAADIFHRSLISRALKDSILPPSAVALPFDQEAPYRAYHCFGAHPLGILGAAGDLRPLLASDYINLSALKITTNGYLGTVIVPWRTIGNFVSSGHCETLNTEQKPIYKIGRSRECIEWLAERVQQGWYIFLHVNKYYIPHSAFHLKRDFLHDCLLVGCNTKEKTFKVAMYLCTGEFGTTEVSFVSMAMALILRGSRRFANPICYAPVALAVRPKEGMQFQFDQHSAKQNLKDYLQSRAPKDGIYVRSGVEYAGDWVMAFGYPTESHSYGLEAFVATVLNIRELITAKQLVDLMSTRALWEHKKIMSANLSFWKAKLAISCIGDDLPVLYAEVVRWTHALHLLSFEYNQDKRYSRELLSHLSIFRSILEIEKEVLARMMSGF
ncbi:MAG TPA: hypothetical protein VGD45_11730 [Steroidobacter sp.]|uniref:TubC N-terminal docking domain-related protein n=1 Tax=Steroidobacter sp. TaxID=1978227 RepID=UPI002ED80762